MRYTAYLNGSLFFDTLTNDPSLRLIEAVLSFEAGKAGSFKFKVPMDNVKYGWFNNISDYITVVRNNEEIIFSGRIYNKSSDFSNVLSITAEGMLAVLNDTIYRPNAFNGTLSDLVTALLANHNNQVSIDKQINLGTITVSDDYIYREYENYESTMSRFEDLVDSYGGYLSVRETENGYFLDWLAEYTEEATQSINFGENLLDVIQESDASDVITVLIPLGAEEELEDGTKRRVTISDLQEQSGKDYIENQTGIDLYGRIVGTYIWNDVTNPANLLTKAIAYLQEKIAAAISIEVNAVDLSGLDLSIESFHVGTKIYVKSDLHDISAWFVCNRQDLDLLDPANNTLNLGNESKGYLSSSASSERNYYRQTNYILSTYAASKDLAEYGQRLQSAEVTIRNQTTSIEQNSEEISLKASADVVNQLEELVNTINSEFRIDHDTISANFGTNGRIDSWFTFDPDKFLIGKRNSPIHSEQDNQSYKFINDSGQVLLEINPEGTISQTVNVNAQVRYLDGVTPQWATRKGKYIPHKGVNLNDLWIGG